MSSRLVLLLGAGATLADVATRPVKGRPPLDRAFFAGARTTHQPGVAAVQSYMLATYARDILERDDDSLERVMSQIYTDMFNPLLKTSATAAFTALLNLFTRRLAGTTNSIGATNRRFFYRIMIGYLNRGVKPQDITVITFNQDLQVEKNLDLLSQTPRWSRFAGLLFNFPACYGIGLSDLTAPPRGPLFSRHDPVPEAVPVLKLHGSLNWYSTHTSRNPSPDAMFNTSRRISITRRRQVSTTMMRRHPHRSTYALPVIVPPITFKSGVLHETMQGVWRRAEEALRRADEVVVFGYSCPQLDVESSSLLRRSLRSHNAHMTIIDPAAAAAARYIELIEPSRLVYYPSASDFLTDPRGPLASR